MARGIIDGSPAAVAQPSPVLLVAANLERSVDNAQKVVFSGLSFILTQGEILFVRGPSGIGKSLLLRTLACLDPLQSGTLQLAGSTPSQIGVPRWRSRVTYVPQARVNFEGTPEDVFASVQAFGSQSGRPRGDLTALAQQMGLAKELLQKPWTQLSGGESQRTILAISLALKPDVLLLDEPTSACDHQAALRVEQTLKESGTALVWVTHDNEQPERVGGRVLELPTGRQYDINPAPPV